MSRGLFFFVDDGAFFGDAIVVFCEFRYFWLLDIEIKEE